MNRVKLNEKRLELVRKSMNRVKESGNCLELVRKNYESSQIKWKLWNWYGKV